MAKIYTFKGKTVEELQKLSMTELAELFPARQRRSLKRGLADIQKKFLSKIDKNKKNLKTHCRDLIILPSMIGKTIKIHNGKEFISVIITGDMVGHYLGEFSQTRAPTKHSAPGVGATRSSSHLSVK